VLIKYKHLKTRNNVICPG